MFAGCGCQDVHPTHRDPVLGPAATRRARIDERLCLRIPGPGPVASPSDARPHSAAATWREGRKRRAAKAALTSLREVGYN